MINDEELFDTVQELVYYHAQYKWLLDDLFIVE